MLDVQKLLENDPAWKPFLDIALYPPTPEEAIRQYPELESSDALYGIMYPTGVARIAMYYRCRQTGSTHRMAEVCACQRSPALMTDSVFFAGLPTIGKAFDDQQLKDVVAIARKHGYNPGPNDVYQSGLARFRGDPEAFISPLGGRHQVKQICERRGWACEGAVNVEAREPAEDPLANSKPLGEDIIRDYMKQELKENPLADKKELRTKIIAEHGMT